MFTNPDTSGAISLMISMFLICIAVVVDPVQSVRGKVVIGAFRCIFLYMEPSQKTPQELFPQIIPPFITLINATEPEIQFVVLRILSLFVKKYPRALSKEFRVFFCKYNDPSYVKLEKLKIIVAIANQKNVKLVLDEFEEYCNSVLQI